MSNKKITDFPINTTPSPDDVLYCVDVSDLTDSTQGSSKKVRVNDLLGTLGNSLPISIKDFGGVGDGVADETAAFVSAAASGKTITVPKGIWKLDSNVSTTVNAWIIDPQAVFTGAGVFNAKRGYWTDMQNGANITKIADRLFVGAGVEGGGGFNNGNGQTWLGSQLSAYWLERTANILSISDYGECGGVFASRTSDKSKSGLNGVVSIGVAALVDNDHTDGTRIGWGAYVEGNRGGGGGGGVIYGMELAIKNKGNNVLPTPYARNGWGAIGIWFPGGGDASYNGAPTNPNSAAMMIGKNASTWNIGIIFNSDGITGTDGVTGTGKAIEMAKGHQIEWKYFNNPLSVGAAIRSDCASNATQSRIIFGSSSFDIKGVMSDFITETSLLRVSTPALTAGQDTNFLFIVPQGSVGGGTGNVRISPAGIDPDCNLTLQPKGGLGHVVLNLSNVRNFVSDATAAAAGVPVGGLYRNGSALQIRVA